MVVHDFKRRLMFMQSSVSSASSAYHAEVLVLDWASKHAERLLWSGVDWCSDALVVVKEINATLDPSGWSSRFSIYCIRNRFDRFDWELGWSPRQSNIVADLLIKLSLESGCPACFDEFSVSFLPSVLLNPLNADCISAGSAL